MCGSVKPVEDFGRIAKSKPKRATYCKACSSWRIRAWEREQRVKMLEAYGGKCACCGENNQEFLAIDHIEGGGRQHRTQLAARGVNFRAWIRKNNFPEGFRLLCHNCNQATGLYGYCPHQGRPESPLYRRKGVFIVDTPPSKLTPEEKSAELIETKVTVGRERRAEQARKRRATDPHSNVKARRYNNVYRKRVKLEALAIYGTCCRCCSEGLDEMLLVTVAPRSSAEKPPTGTSIYGWLRGRGFPTGYITLCRSCIHGYEQLGYCAHRQGVI